MKTLPRLLSTAVLLCTSWMLASATLPPTVMSVDPEDGSTVYELNTVYIGLDYNVYTGTLQATDKATGITLTRDGEPVDASFSVAADFASLDIKFTPVIRIAGTYTLTIPDGAYVDVPDGDGIGGTGAYTPAMTFTFVVNPDLPIPHYLDATPASGSSVEMLSQVTFHFANPANETIKCNGVSNFAIHKIVDDDYDKGYYNAVKDYEVKGNDVTIILNQAITQEGKYEIEVYDYAFSIGNDKLQGWTLEYDVTGPTQVVNSASVTKAEQDLSALTPEESLNFTFNVHNLGTNDITSVGYRLYWKQKEAENWELYEQRTNMPMEPAIGIDGTGQLEARFRTPADQGQYEGKLILRQVNGATSSNTNTTETATCVFDFTVGDEEPVSDEIVVLPNQGTVDNITTLVITFPSLKSATGVTSYIDEALYRPRVTYTNPAGETQAERTLEINELEVGTNGFTALVTFTPAFTEPGTYAITFPKGMFTYNNGEETEVKSFTLHYAISTSGIEQIGALQGEAIYYDLTGKRVFKPLKGVYIKKQQDKTLKVIL